MVKEWEINGCSLCAPLCPLDYCFSLWGLWIHKMCAVPSSSKAKDLSNWAAVLLKVSTSRGGRCWFIIKVICIVLSWIPPNIHYTASKWMFSDSWEFFFFDHTVICLWMLYVNWPLHVPVSLNRSVPPSFSSLSWPHCKCLPFINACLGLAGPEDASCFKMWFQWCWKRRQGMAVCFLLFGISLPFASWCCNEVSCRVPIGLISHPQPLKIAPSAHHCFPRKSLSLCRVLCLSFQT